MFFISKRLFFDLFMFGALPAAAAIFLETDFSLHQFFILAGEIIDLAANAAFQFYEVFRKL